MESFINFDLFDINLYIDFMQKLDFFIHLLDFIVTKGID